MIIDRQLRFCSELAVTASAASTDLIDMLAAQDWAPGTPLWVVVVCTEAMTDTGSNSTVTPSIESDTAAAFSSATTVQTLPAFAATSAAGTVIKAPLAPMATKERFIRMYFTVANGDLSAGKFTAFITPNADTWSAYADGITIS